MPVGTVIEQSPGAGSNVKRSTTIRLTLAKAAAHGAADDALTDTVDPAVP